MNNLLDLNRLDCESNGISGEMREGGEGGSVHRVKEFGESFVRVLG